MESMDVVVRRYIDFLIIFYYLSLLLVSALFGSSISTFLFILYIYTDREIIVSTRWSSLRLTPIIFEILERCRASMGRA